MRKTKTLNVLIPVLSILLAFVVGMLIPGAAGYLALFLLMAMPAAVRIVAKRLDARKARA